MNMPCKTGAKYKVNSSLLSTYMFDMWDRGSHTGGAGDSSLLWCDIVIGSAGSNTEDEGIMIRGASGK